MSLSTRIRESKSLTPQEKLTLGLLANEDMTVRQMTDYLMSDPYDLTFDEVFNALDGLKRKSLIEIAELKKGSENFSIDVYLTFAMDWIFKLPF